MTINTPLPRIAITPGEPAGIGPDIVLASARERLDAELIVIADPGLLEQRAAMLGIPVEFSQFSPEESIECHEPGKLKILPALHAMAGNPGVPHPDNASYILETLRTACNGCLNGTFDAMVTAPVQKSVINQAGIPFTGHTEFLHQVCREGHPVMMLANGELRVALVTTHLPLAEVSKQITRERLETVLRTVAADLEVRFGIEHPRLLVCGLNPHAGEEGHLGREEIEVIIPVMQKLQGEGIRLTGPVPADTAFTPASLQETDVIVSMYHDQGLPPLKASGFGETVNITLGLPVIRTSVDHGTALSLAGSGKAKHSSLLAAIRCAIDMANTAAGTESAVLPPRAAQTSQ